MKNFNPNSKDCAAMAILRIGPSGKAATASLAALLTLALSLGTIGCSRSKTNNQAASNQNSQTQTPASPAPVASPTFGTTSHPAMEKKESAKKQVKKPATVTYTDGTSGVSFTYPRKSTVKAGLNAELDAVAQERLPLNFVQPGGTTMIVLELPQSSTTETGYDLFTISVNKRLSAEQCEQFAGQQSPAESTEKAASLKGPSKLKIGEVEYSQLDTQNEQGAMKYYHRFVPGSTEESSSNDSSPDNACYEFGLAVKGHEQKDGEHVSVNSKLEGKDAFAKLEKILASVSVRSDKKDEVIEPTKTASQVNPKLAESPR